MKNKFAKALAENITIISGNVAEVALIDAGIVTRADKYKARADACEKIEKCKSAITELFEQPGLFAAIRKRK